MKTIITIAFLLTASFSMQPASAQTAGDTIRTTAADTGRLAAVKTLDAINITGNRAYIKQTAGRIVVNVQGSPINAGSNAWEALLRIPGVRADNGNLQAHGKSVAVLLDGKPTRLGGEELKNLLSSLPASSLDKIEVLTNPAARYDAQGGAVINLTSIKMQQYGLNGTATLGGGAGTYGRYNGGASGNYRNTHLNVYGSYDYLHSQYYSDDHALRTTGADTTIGTDQHQVAGSNSHSFKLGMDCDVNKNTAFGLIARSIVNDRTSDAFTQTTLKDAAGTSFSTVNKNGNTHLLNPSVNAYYKTTLDTTGRELHLSGDYFSYHKNAGDDFTTRYFDGKWVPNNTDLLLRDNSPTRNHIASFSADYIQPAKSGLWEMGLKTTFTTTDNNAYWQQQANGTWQTDTTKTNHFIYRENINAAYGTWSKTFGKADLQLGLRAEQTNTDGYSLTLDQRDRHHYINFFPNASVQYNLSDDQQFGFSYRHSIERFGFNIVNPFTTYQSQYAYTQGNPHIRPSTAHSFELSHSFKNLFYTALSYTRYQSVLGDVYRRDPATNALISTWDNLTTADNFELDETFSKAFFHGFWTTNTSVSVLFARYNANAYFGNNQARIAGMLFSGNTFAFGKGWKTEVSASYYSPLLLGIATYKARWQSDFGISKSILKKRGTVSLNVTDLFNTCNNNYEIHATGINATSQSKMESRFVRLGLQLKLGNLKVAASKARRTGIEDEKNRMNN